MPLHFKSYLNKPSSYKGGKSLSEVSSDKKIYKLSSNENQFGSSPMAIEAMETSLKTLSLYPDRTDHRLCKALEQFYGSVFSADQFITTNSGVANIEIIMSGFLEEGTECIICNPAFGAYDDFARKFGANVVDVPLVGNDLHLDVDAIFGAINEHTRLIFITSPNNPTGTYIPKDQVDALMSGVPDHVVVVYDEVYFQFADADDYVRGIPYVKEGKNVIGVNSFSKAYGLAALRVGYSYSTPEIARYLRQLQRPFMINAVSMDAAIGALQDHEFISSTVENIHRERDYLYLHFDRLEIDYWKTQANFILIKPTMHIAEFEEKLFRGGIMIRDAGPFGAQDCARITIGTHEANQLLIETIESILY